MIVTRFPSLEGTRGSRVELEFSALVGELEQHAMQPHDGTGWSPVAFAGDKRAKARVEAVYLLGLDLDGGDLAREDLLGFFGGRAGVVHSTKRYTPTAPRWRVLLVLDRSVSASEYTVLWTHFARELADAGVEGLDVGTKDASRFWYWPSRPAQVAGIVEVLDGDPVDVDAVLAEATPAEPEPPKAYTSERKRVGDRYAEAALDRACDALRAAPKGERNTTLAREAYTIGQLVGAGLLSEHVALLELEHAISAWDPRAASLHKRTLERQFREGTRKPRAPEPKPAPSPGPRPTPGAPPPSYDDDERAGMAGDDDPPPTTSTAIPNDLTDSGHAEAIAHARASDLRYVTSWARWLAWDGVRWDGDRGREVAELAPKAVADALLEEAKDADPTRGKQLAAAAFRLRKRAARESAIALARWEPELAIHHDQLDRAAEHLLCTPSGTVDLRIGALMRNEPARLLTRATSTPYDPQATCPTWERFVLEVCGGDEELAAYLRRAVGYSLTGSIREHVLLFLHGHGSNGKSTFVETIRLILGDYASPIRSESLMCADHTQHPTVWAGLVGTRLVVASEIERGARLAESLVKSVTGGDAILARRMREDFWTFQPQFKLWILGNDRPVVRGTDDGIWRRLRLVPFLVSFLGREDRELPAKFAAEASGILRWAVDGAREWFASGLAEPASVREASASYRAEQDVFGQWVEDCVEVAPHRTASRSELRESYEAWTKAAGGHAIGPRDFTQRIRALGAEEVRGVGKHRRGWQGIGLVRGAEGSGW